MRSILHRRKPIGALLIVAIFCLSIPHHPARAAMVSTESVIAPAAETATDRARIRAFLDRKDVRAEIANYGVDAGEAAARIETLTDREVALIAGRLEEIPAGGAGYVFVPGWIVILPIVLFVLLILGIIASAANSNSENVAEAPQ